MCDAVEWAEAGVGVFDPWTDQELQAGKVTVEVAAALLRCAYTNGYFDCHTDPVPVSAAAARKGMIALWRLLPMN